MKNNRFQDVSLSKADAFRLLARCAGDANAAKRAMPVLDALGRSPAGAYACVNDISETPLSYAMILALRDIFLATVDSGLQELYRDWLYAHPPAVGMRHQDRLALLDPLRSEVITHVSSFDWNWLADWLGLDAVGETIDTSLNRLSNFVFPCDTVNLRFTLHCNIQCRHCYNNSGPRAKNQTANLPELLAIVEQMPDAGLRHLSLSGGEPFLYQEHLAALIETARRVGIERVSINTNGFWAKTAAQADQVLVRIKDAGFMCGVADSLKVSVGPYHQEFIPLETPLMLVSRFYRMFSRKVTLDVESVAEHPEFTRQLRDALASAGLEECVRLRFRNVAPLGRGKNVPMHRPLESGDQPCSEIDTIVFEPDGTARSCCGMNAENQGVVIGRAGDKLADMVKRMQNDPLLQYMAKKPLKQVFQLTGVTPKINGYYGKCDLCQHAVGTLLDKSAIQEKLFSNQAYYPFWFRRRDLYA